MKTNQEIMLARLEAKMNAWLEQMKAWQKKMSACQEVTEAFLEKVKAGLEEMSSKNGWTKCKGQ